MGFFARKSGNYLKNNVSWIWRDQFRFARKWKPRNVKPRYAGTGCKSKSKLFCFKYLPCILSIFRLRIQIWNLITQIRLHRININRKYAQNFDLNTNVFSTHLWRTLASVFCPTFDIAANSKKNRKRHFSKQMFFTFLLNSNYLLGFEGIENACKDYCGNWKVSKKNCFMLTARSISIECAICSTKVVFTVRYTKTNNCPPFFLPITNNCPHFFLPITKFAGKWDSWVWF